MGHYRNLRAWQYAKELAVACSRASRHFPDFEQTALADQLRRACYSVPLNIAEGSSRRGKKEYRRFLDTAWSSLGEVETIIEMALELEYISTNEHKRLESLASETGKTLFGLIRKISGPNSKGTG